MAKLPQAEIKTIDAQTVFDSFSKTKESAGALDGWMPKELSLLSIETCEQIATMLNQIETGAPCPSQPLMPELFILKSLELNFGR